MSQRHRPADGTLPPKEELRAQAHGERHRIHTELQDVANQVSAGLDPVDVQEPGRDGSPVTAVTPTLPESSTRSASGRYATGR